VGNPLCQFGLSKSNAGPPGTVTITVDSKVTAQTFAQIKQDAGGASQAGIGDSAFYVSGTTTLQFIKGTTVCVIQAALQAPGGAPADPTKTMSDTVALGKSVAATI
jgi:hypothetical protein